MIAGLSNVASAKLKVLSLVLVSSVLSACSSVGYRCPLDASEDPESPTACVGMHEANAGAKRGGGSKVSALIDESGRRIPTEALTNSPATARGTVAPVAEPYRNASGEPVFVQPNVYQGWVPAFVDAEGNLHDGHHTWFATPGRWAYGTTRSGETSGGSEVMKPALPSARPPSKVTNTGSVPKKPTAGSTLAPETTAAPTTQEKDKAALKNLSAAADSVGQREVAKQKKVVPPAEGAVTAPNVLLGD